MDRQAEPTGPDGGLAVRRERPDAVDGSPRGRTFERLGERTESIIGRFHRPLNRAWSAGFRLMFVLDAVGLFGLMVALNTVRFGRSWPWFSAQYYLAGFAAATVVHLGANYFLGLYEREPLLGARSWVARVVGAMAIGLAVQGLIALLADRYFMPRLNLVAFGLLGVVLLVVNRRLSRALTIRRLGAPRVVLVGSPDAVGMAARHIAEIEHDAIVVGRAPSIDQVADTVAAGRATDVLLLDVDAFDSMYPEPMTSLERAGVGFLQRVSGRETLLGLRAVTQVAGMPFVRLRTRSVPPHKLRLKRLFDLVVLVITVPVTVPSLIALAIYVRIRAGRPVIYRQVRIGQDGVPFTVVKFRTMVADAERDGAQLSTGRGDARVVRGLGWMRGTRADELPQLWHVLRGQMSWVGPRPERPEMTAEIERRVPGYVRRNEMPPGLTGLAQVYGRYGTDAEYKLGYDLQYIVNWSLALDAQILARTVWVVLSRRV